VHGSRWCVSVIVLFALLAAGASSAAVAGNEPTSAASKASGAVGLVGTADWSTYYHRNDRSGFSLDGPVSPSSVRQQWRSAVLDGQVYAQPLVVGDRVIVATENDSVYSLRVGDGSVAWRNHLGSPVPGSSLPCGNIDPVGITSTPVVDTRANRLYAVGLVRPLHYLLFDLDLTTGRLIASRDVAGGAAPAVSNQRGALALTGGKVFVPYGGRTGDCGDYHGHIVSVAVSATGLGAVHSYTLPTQRQGGFWAPPGPVIASDGSLYITSGNSSSTSTYDYGNSVVHLSATLRLLDSFAPTNWRILNAGDLDLGSTSPVLLPDARVFQVGKSGVGYLLDAAHLGGIGGQLSSRTVCRGSSAFGGVAHDRDRLFVPCSTGIVAVTVRGNTFRVAWNTPISDPGPPIVTPNAIWSVANPAGHVVALDPASGALLATLPIGTTPSHFTSPAAGDGRIFIAAGQQLFALGQ
jgi:outer membrane protein assembly factor BamB